MNIEIYMLIMIKREFSYNLKLEMYIGCVIKKKVYTTDDNLY